MQARNLHVVLALTPFKPEVSGLLHYAASPDIGKVAGFRRLAMKLVMRALVGVLGSVLVFVLVSGSLSAQKAQGLASQTMVAEDARP